MSKTRTYLVSFSPAEKTPYGYRVAISLLTAGKRHEVQASSFPELEREVRRLAAEFGQSCSPYIRMPKGERNPPGFNAWSNSLRFIEAMPALIG